MADDVEMTPVDAAEPPKANPLSAAAAPKVATIKLTPIARKPDVGGAPTAALKPGLKLPPKPGLSAGLKLPPKPGLKLPTVALKPGLKLPPKPVIHKPGSTIATTPLAKPVVAETKPVMAPEVKPVAASEVKPVAEMKPVESEVKPVVAEATPVAPGGLKLPPKPGLKLPTVALKPGLKLPPKPVIRKPGATVTAAPLPKPVAVDAQGVGKLPTVEAKAVNRADTAPVVSANPNPLEALKSVTQKLKGLTQEIPQQAILHKTGIIAEGAMSEAQKEASKHKTARISLSDAMGVAPVKNENAPMKTIRIKRPADISGAAKAVAPDAPAASAPEAVATDVPPVEAKPAADTAKPAPTVTQRKTIKIARPGGAIRPSGKFGLKRPSQATTMVKAPDAAGEASATVAKAAPDADIADIPEIPTAVPMEPIAAAPSDEGPAWLVTLSTVVQAAACIAIGALAWFLYQNTQIAYF